MKIVVDENMPYAYELFSRLGDEIRIVPGRQISKTELSNADALMVRSVTKVNKDLLEGTPVRFVGTATAGTDHVDHIWLKKAGIKFYAALGCNAVAVVEYIISALLILARRDHFLLKDRIVGVVGVGNIGRLLKKRFELLGIRTLLCDPPRKDRGDKAGFISLNELVEQADILTFHTPLFNDGPYKTLHLVDETLISRLRPGSILINTCRGPVVDNKALLRRLEARQNLSVVLDVWETEPNCDIDLLERIDIGTAHIAGYTLEGKARGTKQVFEAYSAFIGKPQQVELDTLLPVSNLDHIIFHGTVNDTKLRHLTYLVYNILRDDSLLRDMAGMKDGFDELRKNYLERREWSSLCITCNNINTALLLRSLGFNAIY